jgi:hypothetical protein
MEVGVALEQYDLHTGRPLSALAAQAAAYREPGADHALLSLAPSPVAHADPAFLERAAAALPVPGAQLAAGG